MSPTIRLRQMLWLILYNAGCGWGFGSEHLANGAQAETPTRGGAIIQSFGRRRRPLIGVVSGDGWSLRSGRGSVRRKGECLEMGGTIAVVVAAGLGSRMLPLTSETPKCMLEVQGRPLLIRALDTFRNMRIRESVVVGGFKADMLALPADSRLVLNDQYMRNNILHSLAYARTEMNEADHIVASYSDIIFRQSVVEQLRSTLLFPCRSRNKTPADLLLPSNLHLPHLRFGLGYPEFFLQFEFV